MMNTKNRITFLRQHLLPIRQHSTHPTPDRATLPLPLPLPHPSRAATHIQPMPREQKTTQRQPGRRQLVRFFVKSALHFGHTESESASSESDSAISSKTLQLHVQNMIETNLLKQQYLTSPKKMTNNVNDELEKILTLTIERLKKKAYNNHSVAGALHNLGCFYAASSNADDNGLEKAISLTSRALTIRRNILNSTNIIHNTTHCTTTPRNSEHDRLALAESLNDQGVLLLCCSRNNNNNNNNNNDHTETLQRLRGEKMLLEAQTILSDIHSFLHPLNITMLRNLAYANQLNGNKSAATQLLRDALARSSTSHNHVLLIGVSLDFADICFRQKHLTKDVIQTLSHAFELASTSRGRESNTYPFDQCTIVTIGYQLAMLYFSRRRYVTSNQWLHRCVDTSNRQHLPKNKRTEHDPVYPRWTQDNEPPPQHTPSLLAPPPIKPTMEYRLLLNSIQQLNSVNNQRIEHKRLEKERKRKAMQAADRQRMIDEQIALGILNPDGSDPMELERVEQEKIAHKRLLMLQKKREKQERLALAAAVAASSSLTGKQKNNTKKRPKKRPKSAAPIRRRKNRFTPTSSVSSSVMLEGKRPRTSPLSSLMTRPTTGGGSGSRRRKRRSRRHRASSASPLDKSAWFQAKKIPNQVWTRTIEQKERRGQRLDSGGGSSGNTLSPSSPTMTRTNDGWLGPPDASHRLFLSPRSPVEMNLIPLRRPMTAGGGRGGNGKVKKSTRGRSAGGNGRSKCSNINVNADMRDLMTNSATASTFLFIPNHASTILSNKTTGGGSSGIGGGSSIDTLSVTRYILVDDDRCV